MSFPLSWIGTGSGARIFLSEKTNWYLPDIQIDRVVGFWKINYILTRF